MLELNRKHQKWRVLNDGRVAFTHQEYRPAALMFIAFSDVDVFAAVVKLSKKHPALAARALAAGLLIAHGHYHHIDSEAGSTYPQAISQPYRVKLERHDAEIYPTCSCQDFRGGTAPHLGGRHFCKHILAHFLVAHLNELDGEVL